MEKLMSDEDKLAKLLSSDTDFILDKSEDILSMKEGKEIQKQNSPLGKMKLLLKTIKGNEATACKFCDIVREHQAHYPSLQQELKSGAQGSSTPTVFADANSAVTTGEVRDTKVKQSLKFEAKTVSQPGRSASGNAAQQVRQANLDARDGSIIMADKVIGATIEGDLTFSACVGQPACLGPVKETLPQVRVTQGPAEKRITEHKVKITECLMADHVYILQHMQQEKVITKRKYDKLMHISQPEESIIDLIDHMLDNGEESCSQFLEVLKQPDVLATFPKLIEMTKNWS
ncbi:uncharacterized protein si:dkey-10c21.1 isoform X1 [Scomber scombrus]|uniref:Uncharacterized protein si:dkey-10c21.1 isoform X1 n=1 Tax=Scomber scombrus TaxID=13677 RepID=A0AAV1NXZ9_SCOSC